MYKSGEEYEHMNLTVDCWKYITVTSQIKVCIDYLPHCTAVTVSNHKLLTMGCSEAINSIIFQRVHELSKTKFIMI